MTTRAATRCWGLALALGTAVPLGCGTKPPATPKTPPALPAYEYAWHADLGSSGSIDLTVGTAMIFAIGGDDALAAFAVGDGRKVWSKEDVRADATLTAAAGLLYIVTPSHLDGDNRRVASRLDVLDQADGHLVWKIDSLPDPVVAPVIAGRTTVIAAGTDVRGYSTHDGFVAWRTPLDAAPVALAADGDLVFVALQSGTFFGIDADTHAASWQTSLASRATSLVAANRKVFVTAEDGTLSAYHQDSGGPPIWQVRRAEVVGRPAVDDALVYVGQFDNTARAYDAGNGTERWRLRLGSRPRSGIRIAGAQVFIPLLTASMATCLARAGQPAGQIPLFVSGDQAAPTDQHLEASAVSDAGVIFRVTRPSSHTAWTLTAASRKAVTKVP